jgi:hypothetical protein
MKNVHLQVERNAQHSKSPYGVSILFPSKNSIFAQKLN